MHMERRFHVGGIAVEAREGGKGKIQGYAAVFYDGSPATEFELWEGMRERIMPGAFDRALKERDDVRGLYNHNPDKLLGRVSSGTLELFVDAKGLGYRISLGETTVAKDVEEFLRRGDLTGSSFSFQVTDQEWRTEGGVDFRLIKGVRLFDVGPVTFPAYEATTAGMRSAGALEEARAAYAAFRAAREAEEHSRRRVAMDMTARIAECETAP
jgi:HK97 family phage prohead protease